MPMYQIKNNLNYPVEIDTKDQKRAQDIIILQSKQTITVEMSDTIVSKLAPHKKGVEFRKMKS